MYRGTGELVVKPHPFFLEISQFFFVVVEKL